MCHEWWTYCVLPSNIGTEPEYQKEQAVRTNRRLLSSQKSHLRAARVADPHPSDHDLDKEDCHVRTGSVSARNLLPYEWVENSYQADKI